LVDQADLKKKKRKKRRRKRKRKRTPTFQGVQNGFALSVRNHDVLVISSGNNPALVRVNVQGEDSCRGGSMKTSIRRATLTNKKIKNKCNSNPSRMDRINPLQSNLILSKIISTCKSFNNWALLAILCQPDERERKDKEKLKNYFEEREIQRRTHF
jgi:hypothetical protein